MSPLHAAIPAASKYPRNRNICWRSSWRERSAASCLGCATWWMKAARKDGPRAISKLQRHHPARRHRQRSRPASADAHIKQQHNTLLANGTCWKRIHNRPRRHLSRHTHSGRSFHTALPTRGFERKPPAVRLRPPHTGIVASHHSEKVTKPAVQRPLQVYTRGTSVRQFFKHVDVHGCAGEDGGVEERREAERERTEGCLCVYVSLRESLWFCGCPVSWSHNFRRTWLLHEDMGDCMTGCLKVGTVEQDSIRTNMPTPSHNTCRIETGRSQHCGNS